MREILCGFTLVAAFVGLLWVGFANAQPAPPPGAGIDTNAEPLCDAGELLDGDGNCIPITDLSDIQERLDNLIALATGRGVFVFVTSSLHAGDLGVVPDADTDQSKTVLTFASVVLWDCCKAGSDTFQTWTRKSLKVTERTFSRLKASLPVLPPRGPITRVKITVHLNRLRLLGLGLNPGYEKPKGI